MQTLLYTYMYRDYFYTQKLYTIYLYTFIITHRLVGWYMAADDARWCGGYVCWFLPYNGFGFNVLQYENVK